MFDEQRVKLISYKPSCLLLVWNSVLFNVEAVAVVHFA